MGRFLFLFFLILFSYSYGENLDSRVTELEKKIKELEQRIDILETKLEVKKSTVKIQNVEYKNPLKIKVLNKVFKPINLREKLWEKTDKIILDLELIYTLDKPAKNIKGYFYIKDKNGRVLMEREVNLNKSFNFISGTDIKPSEKLTASISFQYNESNPDHIKVKEAEIDDITVEFLPLQIRFSDGKIEKYN
ncbi:hypothetical protein [Persephonella sp.]